MNFDDMSDFEVNKELALLVNNYRVFTDADTYVYLDTDDESIVDYCNNWGDIGPLIERYEITINTPSYSCYGVWETCLTGSDGDDGLICHSYADKNPKRAAAICIIKLLESSNEKCS